MWGYVIKDAVTSLPPPPGKLSGLGGIVRGSCLAKVVLCFPMEIPRWEIVRGEGSFQGIRLHF